MLILENIDLTLNKNSKLEYPIFKNLNLKVEKGEFIIIIGGNGAGKSTLLNIISGNLRPDSGKIKLDNRDYTGASQSLRTNFITKVMQDPKIGTIENMTIQENMALALKHGEKRGFSLAINSMRIELFKQKLSLLNLGLENRLNELVSNLSGGQRQALSLIMAIIINPKILLLDEITAALDPKATENIMELANKIVREESCTCIMITHNMKHAIKYGDRMLILKDGQLLKEYSNLEKERLDIAYLYSEF
ncbi:MAG: ABC transporter ATP-binding protein [Alphaproteobacteria bacterium]